MRRSLIETIMGAVVVLAAAVFVYFAYVSAEVRTAPGYEITAKFFRIGGLTRGSDVQVSGIKVGTVTDVSLDADTYDAVVVMTIDPKVPLPVDTLASIGSAGLLSGNYVRLEPGRESGRLAAGGQIRKTRGYRSLEGQINEIIELATTPGASKE